MIELTKWPLDRLIMLAWRLDIISYYEMTPRSVLLDDGEMIVRLDPEEARFYLCGLVRGYLSSSDRPSAAEVPELEPVRRLARLVPGVIRG